MTQSGLRARKRNELPAVVTLGSVKPARRRRAGSSPGATGTRVSPTWSSWNVRPVPRLSVPAKHTAGSQHSGDLGQESILLLGRGHVMEHREANHAREATVREWHRGGVRLNDRDLIAELTP
jgi:hypothetical protein